MSPRGTPPAPTCNHESCAVDVPSSLDRWFTSHQQMDFGGLRNQLRQEYATRFWFTLLQHLAFVLVVPDSWFRTSFLSFVVTTYVLKVEPAIRLSIPLRSYSWPVHTRRCTFVTRFGFCLAVRGRSLRCRSLSAHRGTSSRRNELCSPRGAVSHILCPTANGNPLCAFHIPSWSGIRHVGALLWARPRIRGRISNR